MDSLRQRIIKEISNNPLISTRNICQKLKIDYKKYKQYIWNLKTNYKNEQASNRSISFHAVRFYGFALKSFSRDLALEKGWILSKSKNKRLIYKCSLGRLEWFLNGRITVWIHKPVSEGRLFQILCFGFSYSGLIEESNLDAFLHSFKYKGAHLVQDVGESLPYAKNTTLKGSLGVVVKLGDKSHPKGLEIEFCLPKWAEEFKILTELNIKTIESFAGFLGNTLSPKSKDFPREMVS